MVSVSFISISTAYLFAAYTERHPSLHVCSFLISATARTLFKCSNEQAEKLKKIAAGSDENADQFFLAVTVITGTNMLPEVQINYRKQLSITLCCSKFMEVLLRFHYHIWFILTYQYAVRVT